MSTTTLPAFAYAPQAHDATRYQSTELTRGPWHPDHQHAGPPIALVCGAFEAAAQAHGLTHIARLTAESGHWLPLQSEIIDTRNTKPPLLFWQAMVAGNWGQSWSLFTLRLPSVVYTFATTALLAFFTHRMSGKRLEAVADAISSGNT